MTETPDPGQQPEMTDAQYWHFPRLLIAWLITLALGVLVLVLVPAADRYSWLAFAIGLSALVTFALQLGTAQREGFITRTSFSIAGSVVIIAVLDLINWLLTAW